MKEYKWDLDKFRLMRRKLISEKRKLTNLNKILSYEEAIQIYQGLLEEHNINAKLRKESGLESDNEVIVLEDFFNDVFREVNPSIINFLIKNIKLVQDADLKMKYDSRKILGISNRDLIDIVHDIYRTIPNQEIYSEFLKIINPSNHLLDIEYCPYEYPEYDGICRVDSINHVAYGKILRGNSIQDVFTLAHEIMHMIVRRLEKPLFLFENRRYYSEYEGHFINFIVYDYLLKHGYDKDDVKDFAILNYLNVACTIEDSYACRLIEKSLKDSGEINFSKIDSYQKKQGLALPLDEENYFQYISSNYDSKVWNALSFFVALDLLEAYKKDKEKGIYLFQKVSTLSGDNPKKELENIGINFMSDNSHNFKKYIKQLKND